MVMNPLSGPTYLVLLSLYHEPLHGYGIIKFIENISENDSIAPGTLYGVLKNLEKQGMVETIHVEIDQRKKKTYCITDSGKEALKSEFNRYQSMIKLTRKIISEGELKC
jgi:DNA-binding PadR family transcriptional regulator